MSCTLNSPIGCCGPAAAAVVESVACCCAFSHAAMSDVPPTSAKPPSIAVTRWIASRRLIVSIVMSSLFMVGTPIKGSGD